MTTVFFFMGLTLLLFLWIPFLLLGIKRLKRGDKVSGIFFTAIAGIWGLIAIPLGIILLISSLIYFTSKKYEARNFESETYKGKTGTLSINWNKPAEALLRQGNKNFRFKSDNGLFVVPVGDWKLYRLQYRDNDSMNKEWLLAIDMAQKLSIKDGQISTIKNSLPLSAKIHVARQSGHFVRLSFLMTDRNMNRAHIWGPYTDAAGFQILNKQGNVVFKGKFKYG
jgi:hypothetical protein